MWKNVLVTNSLSVLLQVPPSAFGFLRERIASKADAPERKAALLSVLVLLENKAVCRREALRLLFSRTYLQPLQRGWKVT